MLNQLIKEYLIKRRKYLLLEILPFINEKRYFYYWLELYQGVYCIYGFYEYLCNKNKYYLNLILCSFDTSYILKYIKVQSPEICLTAVKQYGDALHYVKDQTHEICLAAVKRDGLALKYVKEQTPEICLVAVKQNGLALQFVNIQTPEICVEAVRQNEKAIMYINKNIIIKVFDYYTKTKI